MDSEEVNLVFCLVWIVQLISHSVLLKIYSKFIYGQSKHFAGFNLPNLVLFRSHQRNSRCLSVYFGKELLSMDHCSITGRNKNLDFWLTRHLVLIVVIKIENKFSSTQLLNYFSFVESHLTLIIHLLPRLINSCIP